MNQRWPGEWMRGVLELAVLAVLREGPTHGYALARALEAAGLGQIKGGTLYPLLNRLEAEGLLATSWEGGTGGPGRKALELTDAGCAEFERRRGSWREFTGIVAQLCELGAVRPTTEGGRRW